MRSEININYRLRSGMQHHVLEFLKIKLTIQIGVEHVNHTRTRTILIQQSESHQHILQLLARYEAVAVGVENSKRLLHQVIIIVVGISVFILGDRVVEEEKLIEVEAWFSNEGLQVRYAKRIFHTYLFQKPLQLLQAYESVSVFVKLFEYPLQVFGA